MISKSRAWMMWLIISIFYAYQYILRVMPSVMLEDITNNWHLNIAEFGQLSGIYYLGYALIHLPMGIMLDRYMPKIVIPICILLCSIGMMPLLYSENWIYPLLGRFILGIGSSAAILGAFKVIRIAFNEEKFTKMLGLTVMIGLFGAIYGGGPLYYIKSQIGFYNSISILIFLGLILAILSYFIIPKTLVHHNNINNILKSIFSNKSFIVICVFSGFMVGPIEGFADVWAKTYLKIVYNFADESAASIPSLIFIGMSIGAPLLGNLTTKNAYHLKLITFSGFILAISFILFMNIKLSIMLISGLFFIIGIFSAYQIIAIPKASSYINAEFSSTANASANMIIIIFGYLFHSAIGSILGKNDIDASSLNFGIGIIPIGLLIGFVGFFILTIREKNRYNYK